MLASIQTRVMRPALPVLGQCMLSGMVFETRKIDYRIVPAEYCTLHVRKKAEEVMSSVVQ